MNQVPKRPKSIPIPILTRPFYENSSYLSKDKSTSIVLPTKTLDKKEKENISAISAPKIVKKDEQISQERVWEIINNITSRTCLPHMIAKPVPSYLAMSGLALTTTGPLPRKVKEKLVDLVAEMNGCITLNYTMMTTHVIATNGVTEKVQMARKKGLPVMTLNWVDAVYEACQKSPYVHAKDKLFLEHACPLFYNVHFNISNLISKEVRNNLKVAIIKHGGKISTNFMKEHTDIYITQHCRDPLYLKAREFDIRVILPSWVFVCVVEKTIEDIKGYEIKWKEPEFTFVIKPSEEFEKEPPLIDHPEYIPEPPDTEDYIWGDWLDNPEKSYPQPVQANFELCNCTAKRLTILSRTS